jgi:CopG family nickel-responsive transcriptional regulator
MSSKLSRTGISLPSDLLHRLDRFITKTGYSNRSEAIRSAVDNLMKEYEQLRAPREGDHMGALMALFDLSEEGAAELLHEVQHKFNDVVNTVVHMHLVDPHNCLELLVVRGKGERVNELMDRLMGSKGVREIKSMML